MPPQLNLPPCRVRIRSVNDKTEIWDDIRKKWLVCTPEEWVRQHFIRFLVEHRGVPPLMIRQEMPLEIFGVKRRPDIVVFASDGRPVLIVECKAPEVRLSNDALQQAAKYNLALGLKYLLITNGMTHYCYRYDETEKMFRNAGEIPDYRSLENHR